MSSALPYMQFYVADYLADTVHLSTLEHGAYLLLLFNYWQRGEPLDSDDKRLSRIAQMSMRDWLKVKGVVAEFFFEEEGKWHHKRVERELGIAEAHVEQRRNAGRASAKRRANETSTGVSTEIQRPLNECAEIPEQNREEQNREEKKSSLRSHKENGAEAPANGGEQKIPRASRLPEGWEPFDENYDLAISWGLIDSEIRTEHAKFTDYWTAKSGKDATKTDWDATWRNWMRKAADDKQNKIQKQRAFEDRYKHH